MSDDDFGSSQVSIGGLTFTSQNSSARALLSRNDSRAQDERLMLVKRLEERSLALTESVLRLAAKKSAKDAAKKSDLLAKKNSKSSDLIANEVTEDSDLIVSEKSKNLDSMANEVMEDLDLIANEEAAKNSDLIAANETTKKKMHVFAARDGAAGAAIAPCFNLAMSSQEALVAFGNENAAKVVEIEEEMALAHSRTKKRASSECLVQQTINFVAKSAKTSECFDILATESGNLQKGNGEMGSGTAITPTRFQTGAWLALCARYNISTDLWKQDSSNQLNECNIDKILNHNLGDRKKVPFLAVIVVKVNFLEEGAMAVISDPTGEMQSEVHSAVLSNKAMEFVDGAAVVLKEITVFRSHINREGYATHSAIITTRNIDRIFSPNTPHPSQFLSTAPNSKKLDMEERPEEADDDDSYSEASGNKEEDALLGWLSQNASENPPAKGNSAQARIQVGKIDSTPISPQQENGGATANMLKTSSTKSHLLQLLEEEEDLFENSATPQNQPLSASNNESLHAAKYMGEPEEGNADDDDDDIFTKAVALEEEIAASQQNKKMIKKVTIESGKRSTENVPAVSQQSSRKSSFNDDAWLEESDEELEDAF